MVSASFGLGSGDEASDQPLLDQAVDADADRPKAALKVKSKTDYTDIWLYRIPGANKPQPWR